MEIQLDNDIQFIEKYRPLDSKKLKFPQFEDILFYYNYNLDYNGKNEEEHKLQSWNEWIINILNIEKKLFMPK